MGSQTRQLTCETWSPEAEGVIERSHGRAVEQAEDCVSLGKREIRRGSQEGLRHIYYYYY